MPFVLRKKLRLVVVSLVMAALSMLMVNLAGTARAATIGTWILTVENQSKLMAGSVKVSWTGSGGSATEFCYKMAQGQSVTFNQTGVLGTGVTVQGFGDFDCLVDLDDKYTVQFTAPSTPGEEVTVRLDSTAHLVQ